MTPAVELGLEPGVDVGDEEPWPIEPFDAMTSDCSMKLEEFEELSSRRRRGACGLDGEALEPSDVTGLRRRWPGATLREDIGVARLLSSLIVREAVPAVEESAPGFATHGASLFFF